MRYYFDTEFIEDGKTIDLISIGIVAEDGREYYAVSHEFNPCKASQWVKDNVLVHLPPAPRECWIFNRVAFPVILNPGANYWAPEAVDMGDPSVAPSLKESAMQWKSLDVIKSELLRYFAGDAAGELWGNYCAYDFVAFAQLMSRDCRRTYNPMSDCYPKGLPWFACDIQQAAKRTGVDLSVIPKKDEHHALADARWVKSAHEYILGGCRETLKQA
jgi:hypothetical protein